MYVIKLPCCLSRAGFGSPLTAYCLNYQLKLLKLITNENMSKSTVNLTSLGLFDNAKVHTKKGCLK
jgi:hypothetical protein